MTWCSTLKAKACELIPCFYGLGEDQTPENNKINAELLICQSAFICNGIDEKVYGTEHLSGGPLSY